VTGLLRLCDELKNRGVFAILIMNNFWQWSGGFCQYRPWPAKAACLIRPPFPGGSWTRTRNTAGTFYANAPASSSTTTCSSTSSRSWRRTRS